MDVYTVIFTSTIDGEAESIPWQLSFSDLDLAKNHVLEEAEVHRASRRISDGEEHEGILQFLDYEEYSTLTDQWSEDSDTWLIVRTELVEAAPSGQMSAL